MILGFADGCNRVVVAGSKQTERPHVPMANNSIRIDHENRARDLSWNQRLRAIKISDLSIDVCQQTQWQFMMLRKTLMGINCVRRKPDDLCSSRDVIFPAIADRAHLARADRRFVARIKEEHDHLATIIRQTPLGAFAIGQREVRGRLSFL